MGTKTKFILVALAILGAIVAFRELPLGAAPPKKDGHAHSHGKKENAHAETKKNGAKDDHGHDHGSEAQGEGFVRLSSAQIENAGIDIAPVAPGTLIKEITVPGNVVINADRQAKIVPRLAGTVAKINRRMGEPVAADDVLAVIESREMADAKADYLASWRAEELARSTYKREERLWQQKVTAEQDLLSARNAHQSAKIKLDLAQQKLLTAGLSKQEVAALPTADEANFRFYDLRSPIAGRVTNRTLVLGQSVGTDKDVFTIADLSTVWIDMAIPPLDLPFAQEGQEVRVQSGKQHGTGKIIALSPVIDPDTRSAKAIAELGNTDSAWKLGDFVVAQLVASQQEVGLLVPRDALQDIKGTKAVFVSQGGGFKLRPVTIGRQDSINAEVISGLEFGEPVAVKNTFILKAELGKAEAEHQH